ncbi:MAG: toll/interleukin-1 receptor domain-containing protein [Parabacteroides sp.]|nr:toll/interleukin-1 receptor domain-containing protein [Parabacteroides sp.]
MEKIFISHASKDCAIAGDLADLIENFLIYRELDDKYKVFYAPKDLNSKLGTTEWKKDIKKNMDQSTCCLVVFTRNSVENRWVNYELGLASASPHMKKIIPVCVSGIDFNLVIVNEIHTIKLYERQSIPLILKNIFEKENEAIDKWCMEPYVRTLIKRIRYKSKEKCAYFVGDCPEQTVNKEKWAEKAHYFVNTLAVSLLKEDFKLASFPAVENIGKLVAHRALEIGASRYEIAGLYEFDKKTVEFQRSQGINDTAWEETLEKFRRIYLENKDCMIIIGGNQNTKKEYEVARSMGKIRICPIPCLGGFGKELYEQWTDIKRPADFNYPCCRCEVRDDERNCPYIKEFVENLKSYEIVFKDE